MLIIVKYVARYLRTVQTFEAPDPWNQGRRTSFQIAEYVMTPEPNTRAVNSRFFERRFSLRSEIDGAEHMLPDALVYLWKKKRIPSEALPGRLRLLEPHLDSSDYLPMLERRWLQNLVFWMFVGFFVVPLWSIMAAEYLYFDMKLADLWWALAGCIAATALVFLFGRLSQRNRKRRFQQINLALGGI